MPNYARSITFKEKAEQTELFALKAELELLTKHAKSIVPLMAGKVVCISSTLFHPQACEFC